VSAAVPSWTGVLLSVSLVAIAVLVAARARVGLTRELLVTAARAGVQLVAVGAVLLTLFRRGGLPGAFGWVALMVVVAGEVAARRGSGLPKVRLSATAAVATGAAATLGVLLAARVVPAEPRVVVPVGGMVVSGSMQATGVALRRIREQAAAGRQGIEARLALGLSSADAFAPYARSSVRTALIPVIDNTKVVGLISLPGAMTGLILAGVDPLTAIRYQIVVMYMLLAATAIAALVATVLAQRALFDDAHRLRLLPSTEPRRKRPDR
jgi:putative ABC transport system permease protein